MPGTLVYPAPNYPSLGANDRDKDSIGSSHWHKKDCFGRGTGYKVQQPAFGGQIHYIFESE